MPLHFLAAAIISTIFSGALAQQMLPYSDAGCQNAINATYTGSPDPSSPYYFDIVNGVSNTMNANTFFDDLQFPGASFASGSSAYNVWWKAPNVVGSGCRLALMTDYSQFHYGQLGGPIQTYGNVIINADQDGGCYYSAIPAGSELAGTFCCGTGDCSLMAAGNPALTLKKRELESEQERDLEFVSKDEVEAPIKHLAKKYAQRGPKPKSASSGSSAARAHAAVAARDGCTATTQGSVFPAAGYQTLVANTQTCTIGACSFAISHGLTLSTTLTSESSQTITNSLGGSVAVEAGEDFFVESLKVTTTFSYEYAKAIESSTSDAVQNGTIFTVTNNLGQALGTTAFATFTPTYNCVYATVDCGYGASGPIEYCTPALSSDGSTVLGDYTVVYTNP